MQTKTKGAEGFRGYALKQESLGHVQVYNEAPATWSVYTSIGVVEFENGGAKTSHQSRYAHPRVDMSGDW